MSAALKIFISYARKDAALRAEFEVHLNPLKQDRRITAWHDGQISAGTEWEAEIQRNLQEAAIILLLVTPDFLNSQYVWDNELKQAIERHDRGEARVIPILLRPAYWKKTPLSKIQLLPRDATPITKWPDRDEAYLSVIEAIDEAIEQVIASQAKNNHPVINTLVEPPAITPARSILVEPKPSFSFEIVTVNPTGQIIKGPTKSVNYYRESLADGVDLDMVMIPEGSFLMGSPQSEIDRIGWESPQHKVSIQSFLMGKYAVTQAQWAAVAKFPKVKIDLNPDPSRFKGPNRPVERVNWFEAEEFCARLSKRTGKQYHLPSEAEWEYACRAGTTTPFYFGETINTDLANYDGNYTYGSGPDGEYREKTTRVGNFPANAFGLYDMHGNVWEWCADHWHDSYGGAPTNGSAWLSSIEKASRLLRGGSWSNSPRNCRSAYRFHGGPDIRGLNVGFRLALTPP